MVQFLLVELFDNIACFSSADDLPRLSTVSRAWQSVIERHTMCTIHIKSTDLKDFSNIFVHHNRRTALINLSYEVVLPAYVDHHCARFENDLDSQRNNEALTDAVHSLFAILHSWDEENCWLGKETTSYQLAGRISLTLNAHSPLIAAGRPYMDQLDRQALLNGRRNSFERRYKGSFLRISRCDELPALSRIRSFQVKRLCYVRRIEGASLAGVAAKLPNLETIVWAVNDDEKCCDAERQQHRFEFARSLAMLPLHSLKRVELAVFNKSSIFEDPRVPSALLPSAPSTDHLSLALHALSLSPSLTHLGLGGVLSPCFFWPQDSTTSTPFWPHLQYLIVSLSNATPQGDWLNMWEPEYSDDDDDDENDEDVDPLTHPDLSESAYFGIQAENKTGLTYSSNSKSPQLLNESLEFHWARSESERFVCKLINVGRINPMLRAMARAARHMPAMRRLCLLLDTTSFSSVEVYLLARGGGSGENSEREEAGWSGPDYLQAAWEIVGAEDDEHDLIKDKPRPIYLHARDYGNEFLLFKLAQSTNPFEPYLIQRIDI